MHSQWQLEWGYGYDFFCLHNFCKQKNVFCKNEILLFLFQNVNICYECYIRYKIIVK